MSSRPTQAVAIFLEMARAARAGTPMLPRSAGDKEYFAQDWFKDRLKSLGLAHQQQGRNSYPDFWVDSPSLREGFEIKSLSFSDGRPARRDIDFNSTIPSGRKGNRDIFLVFFLYTGTGGNPRGVHTIFLAHGDLINSDHEVADEHLNVAVRDFGSYADGFIRNRKMYVFPHPGTIDPSGIGRSRLIVPADWGFDDPRIQRVGTIERSVAPLSVDSYTIKLRGMGQAEISKIPHKNAGNRHQFDVYEARG